MKRTSLVIVLGILSLLSVSSAWAITGVGALADRISSGEIVNVTGKTAPWAEVVIVDPQDGDKVIAVAEIEGSGEFVFKYRVNSSIASRLEIFAADELGLSNRVRMGDVSGEVLLPPTIVEDDSDSGSSNLALTGYTHPGTAVEIFVENNKGYTDSFVVGSDSEGRWFLSEDGLPSGSYKAYVIGGFGGLISKESQIIEFDILAISLGGSVGIGGVGSVIPEGFGDSLNQAAKNVSETILQIGKSIPLPEPVANFIEEEPAMAAQVVAPVAAVPVVGLVASDLLALLLKLGYGVLHLFGWRGTRRSWGVVYDAVTKERLSRVIVRMYEVTAHKLVETDVTGRTGVFAFLPKAGVYMASVVRSGYRFPSQIVTGSRQDGEYSHIYHGEILNIHEDDEVDISIPVDPIKVEVGLLFYIRRYLGWIWSSLSLILLFVGTALALRGFLLKVSIVTGGVLAFYIGLLIYNFFGKSKGKAKTSVVRDVATGHVVPDVSVALYEVEYKRLIQRRVSNEKGRMLLVVPPGRYRIQIAASDWILDPTKVGGYKGEEIVVRGRRNKALKLRIWVTSRV